MKTFNEIIVNTSIFEGIDLSYLNEQELIEAVALYEILNESVAADGIEALEVKLQEGFFGAVAGFVAGPAIGKVIANALGIDKGILYDMLTSRLVSAALGSAIQKNL